MQWFYFLDLFHFRRIDLGSLQRRLATSLGLFGGCRCCTGRRAMCQIDDVTTTAGRKYFGLSGSSRGVGGGDVVFFLGLSEKDVCACVCVCVEFLIFLCFVSCRWSCESSQRKNDLMMEIRWRKNEYDVQQPGYSSEQCYWGGRDLASEFESDFVKLHQVPPFRLPWCPFEGSHRKIRLLMDQTSDGSRTITWSGSSWR